MLRILTPWDSQPQEAVGVDWGNPLSQGLKSAVLILPGAAYDSVTGAIAAPSGFAGTPTSGFVLDVGGWNVAFDGTNDYLSFGSYRGGTNATGLTIACRLKLASVSINQRIVVIRVGGVSFQIAGYSSSQIGAFTAGAALGGASPAVGTWVTVFAEFAPTTNAAVGVYIDKGSLLSTSLGAGGDTTTAQYTIGSQDGANRFSSATVNRVFVFDRVLSASDRAQIVDDPWSLFAPRSIWVPVSAGASGTTVTGNLGTASASGYTATIGANRLVAGALGTATASGYTSTVGVNKSFAGIVGVANAIGYQATISTTSDTTVNGVLGTASASGYTATIGVNRLIAGVLGTATATGYTATVANTNDTTVNSNLGVAAATGFTATIGANRTVAGVVGVATAVGFTATVVAGGSPVYSENSGLWLDIGSKLSLPLDPPRMPNWNTAGRPSAPQDYEYGFNTTTGAIEVWTGSAWV